MGKFARLSYTLLEDRYATLFCRVVIRPDIRTFTNISVPSTLRHIACLRETLITHISPVSTDFHATHASVNESVNNVFPGCNLYVLVITTALPDTPNCNNA